MSASQLPPLLTEIRQLFPADHATYLVGGAVRDLLLGKPVVDLDLVMTGGVEGTARRAAAALGCDLYPLDATRGAYRLLLGPGQPQLDICRLQGGSIQEDLSTRDFTINAMALSIDRLESLIDPLGGASDLQRGILRACRETSLTEDPVRLLRAARFASVLMLRMDPGLVRQVREHSDLLPLATAERRRDEFFKGLSGNAAVFLKLLIEFQFIPGLIPSLGEDSAAMQQWARGADRIDRFLQLLETSSETREENLWAGVLYSEIRPFLADIRVLVSDRIHQDRTRKTFWQLACLDWVLAGKADWEDIAAQLVLSNPERSALLSIQRGHTWLRIDAAGTPKARQVFQFYRHSGSQGVDAALLDLMLGELRHDAGHLAPPSEQLRNRIRPLLDAWWNGRSERVSPTPFLNGFEIQRLLGIPAGQQIGEMLARLTEEQAAGTITSRPEAERFLTGLMQGKDPEGHN